MTDRVQISTGQVTVVTISEPHSLGLSFLQCLLTILTERIDSSTRALVLTTSHPEALLADVAALKRMGLHEAFAFSLFSTADQKEGMTAFLEKRPAKFVGA